MLFALERSADVNPYLVCSERLQQLKVRIVCHVRSR
jgi:hypothetical protein